jgi:phosphate transport system substrate-binding protein
MPSILTTMMLLLVLTLTSASATQPPEVRVGGGGAACKGFIVPYKESYEAETGVKITIIPSTPAQGLIDLVNGKLDIATCAVPLAVAQAGALKSGVKIVPAELKVAQIGVNQTLVFVHKTNQTPGLSKQQLQNIFTGRIKNWAAVGGADREIVVVWSHGTPGQNSLFISQILDGAAVAESAVPAVDYAGIRDQVARNPGAIGIDPQGYASAATRNPVTPPITSPVIAVMKIGATKEAEKFLTYLKMFIE